MVRNVPGCNVTRVVENPMMTSNSPIAASTNPMMSSFVPGRLFSVAVFSVMPLSVGYGAVFKGWLPSQTGLFLLRLRPVFRVLLRG